MARTKKAELIASVDLASGSDTTVLVFKAHRPMSPAEFDLFSAMVRAEQERSGVSIVCMPYSADVEIRKPETKPATKPATKKVAEKAGE